MRPGSTLREGRYSRSPTRTDSSSTTGTRPPVPSDGPSASAARARSPVKRSGRGGSGTGERRSSSSLARADRTWPDSFVSCDRRCLPKPCPGSFPVLARRCPALLTSSPVRARSSSHSWCSRAHQPARGGLGRAVAVPAVAVAGDAPQIAVDLQDHGGGALQERTVVSDGDEGAPMGAEMVLQPADGGCVEVIGGLVEQQQFGRRGQHAGQGQPGLLPAGQGAECAVPGEVAEPEAVQRGVGPGIRLVAAAFLVRRQQVAVGREPRVGGLLMRPSPPPPRGSGAPGRGARRGRRRRRPGPCCRGRVRVSGRGGRCRPGS